MTLKSRLPQLHKDIERGARRGLERAAVKVTDEARKLCPKDTTALSRTIRNEDTDHPLEMVVIAGDASAINPKSGGGVVYAPYVEYGTSRAAAQPFMTPAAGNVDVGAEIRKAIREATK